MNSNWPLRKLSDITNSLNAKRVPVSSLERQKRQGPYRYYGASGVVDYVDNFIFDGTYLLVSEDGENLRTRNTPIAFKASGKYWVNNHAHILDETEPGVLDFLEHAFRLLDISPYITGAVQPKLNKRSLEQIELPVPDVEDRLRVNNLLCSFDDKIELNRRMNETLEEMARALFRDWFVDFGPVKRKQAGESDPIKILGGAIPNPEKAFEIANLFPATFNDDGLPDGWENGKLNDWATSSLKSVKPDDVDPDTKYIGLEHMPRRSIALGEWETAKKVTSNKASFTKGQVLFGKLRPYFHKVGIAAVDGICSTDIVVVDGVKQSLVPFVTTLVSSDEFVTYTTQSSTGTKMPRTSWKLMRDYPFPRPPLSILEAFGELVQPFHNKIVHSLGENQTLAEMRDLLLPKLMSGEIRFKDEAANIEAVDNVVSFSKDLLGEDMLSPEQEDERDAAIVAATVRALQEDDLIVGNVRVMKGTYLVKRKLDLSTAAFEKKAAGPYDRALNHEIRGMARARSWIKETSPQGKRYRGNVPASKIREIEPLIEKYGLRDAIHWLANHFKGKIGEWMECVATVDVAKRELLAKGLEVNIANIKADIARDPEWEPKLKKAHFSDTEIKRALKKLDDIF